MKKIISTALTLSLLISHYAYAQWYFRGTPNNWDATPMLEGTSGNYFTCQYFRDDNPRFKIDKFKNWEESYPSQSKKVSANSSQLISFNTKNKTLNIQSVDSCNPKSHFSTRAIQTRRGPYLQTLTPVSVTVRWQSHLEGKGVVRYGTQSNALTLTTSSHLNTGHEHSVTLPQLQPNTRYYYAIGLANNVTVRDPDMFFTTAPVTGSQQAVRIWVSGDTGDSRANDQGLLRTYQSYLQNTQNKYTHVWLMLGDNAYQDGRQDEYQRHLFDIFPKLLKQTALWPTYGNHDAHASSATRQSGPYFDIFDLPKKGEAGGEPSQQEAFYSFNYGNIHFISLDSSESAGRNLQAMQKWLAADLAKNAEDKKTQWLIAFFHHPPYSKGSHDSDNARDVDGTNDTWGGVSEMKLMRENFIPLLERYSADLVLSGHSHAYERSMLIGGHYKQSQEFINNPENFIKSRNTQQYFKRKTPAINIEEPEGTLYVVAGSAAKSSRSGALNHPVMVKGLRDLGSVVLTVEGLTLTAQFITDSQQQTDLFSIHKKDGKLPPIARISNIQKTAKLGSKIDLKGDTSFDPDGRIVQHQWRINDVNIATTANTEYTFSHAGQHIIALRVTDNDGLTHTSTSTVDTRDHFAYRFETLFVRGTHNAWGKTSMTLIDDHLWEAFIRVTEASAEVKFDRTGDWSDNYGKSNRHTSDSDDKQAQSSGGNIMFSGGPGQYRIRFNDSKLSYSIQKL